MTWLILAGVSAAFVLGKCVLIWFGYPINGVNTLLLFPLTAMILSMLLKHPLERRTAVAGQARTCANFIYYMHIACVLVVERGFAAVLHVSLDGVGIFLVTVTVLTVVGLVLHRIKWIRALLN